MGRNSRGQHAHQTALANDPTKDISANQWNDVGSVPAHIETGLLGFPASVAQIVLSSNKLSPVDTKSIVKASSGTTDTLSFIDTLNTNDDDIFWLVPFSGHTITVSHNAGSPPANSGSIILLGGQNRTLDANIPMAIKRVGTTFYEYILNIGIVNTNVASNAGIVYGKLNLAGSILNSDIANSAAIVYSKLNLAGSIVNADINSSAAIDPAKMDGTKDYKFTSATVGTVYKDTATIPRAWRETIDNFGDIILSYIGDS